MTEPRDRPALSDPAGADADPGETAEWIESLDAVVAVRGSERARFLLEKLASRATVHGCGANAPLVSDYLNTIPPGAQPAYPGDVDIEKRLRALVRWNAMAMVTRANLRADGLGGHLSSFASAATLYDVGFHHFFRGPGDAGVGGDQVFVQGHAAPGIYARAFLEGRLAEGDLDRFRHETAGGLPSYPHPRRMPSFWQFPTVSMGLGLLGAIHQARINRYLAAQQVADTAAARVWYFAGDGEMDEPEATASLALAAREGLDNLIVVVNCNLQRLDGPVRGNAKVISELEGVFRGAGWDVVKVVWGSDWDPLLAADTDGVLVERMNTVVDGDFQRYSVSPGAHIRDHFFGTDPRLAALVAGLDDRQLERLSRGGHDPVKVHAAYAAATAADGRPTVVLAKTVKGWALGSRVEARNSTHQIKKMPIAELRDLRDRLELPIPDEAFDGSMPPYHHPGRDSDEVAYLLERRAALGGPLPARRSHPVTPLPAPPADLFADLRGGSTVPASTTGAMARLTRALMADPTLGRRVVPIVADEARTFGLDALFATHGIYEPGGQRYEPVDAALALHYHEAPDGRLLQEGISEAAALADFTALATSYSTWGEPMVPLYFYYSMFGFQRVGDAIWAAGDQRARGFLLGGTAGRTTLSGEGLQHCDGHSLLAASVHPSVRAYDCAYAYEVAAVVEAGLAEMADTDVIYYVTLYNETYAQPPEPSSSGVDGVSVADAIAAGAHRVAGVDVPDVRLLGSGPLVAEALAAADWLAGRGIAAEVWSVSSYAQLRRGALAAERAAALAPLEPAPVPFVAHLAGVPVVAVSDWVRAVPEQIARFVAAPFEVCGTDGWGLSDTRDALRAHFEVDRRHVALAALRAVGADRHAQAAAIDELGIDADASDPADGIS